MMTAMGKTTQNSNALLLREGDDVAVLLADISRDDVVTVRGGENLQVITAVDDIPRFHKISLREMSQNTEIVRGGYKIGRATQEISGGAWVHTHNLISRRAQDVKKTQGN